MTDIFDIIIVGGGIVGVAAGYKIQEQNPRLKVLVLEKEDQLAKHQTGRNSGVIHSGLYYKPGSYKAKNCVQGRRQLVKFAQKYQVPHEVCGKVVVAVEKSELPFLNKIFQNGLANQTEGIEMINGSQIREIEPYCAGIQGIWVPCTGIIDYVAATNKMAELIQAIQPDSAVLTGQKVVGINKEGEKATVITQKQSFVGRKLIFCGGLFSDRLAKLDGVKTKAQIVGFRGDYYYLTTKGKERVRNIIYPVPNPKFPFLGVHFTRMIDGEIECGPNAVFTFKREGYGKTDFSLKDTMQALGFIGTWRFFFKHWRFGVDEYRRAFSKRMFFNKVRKLIPSLEMDEIVPGRSGVRAMALGPEGSMIDDFKIEYEQDSIHVLNAPSPAATSALAIGDAIREMAETYFNLKDTVS